VSAKVEKDIEFLAPLDVELTAVVKDIVLDQTEGVRVDGYPTFFVPFADDLEQLLAVVDVGEFEIDQFGYPQSTAIENFGHDVVACWSRFATVEGCLHGFDVAVGQHVGKVLGTSGHFYPFGRIFGNGILDYKPMEESPPSRQDPALGGGFDVDVGQLGSEGTEMLDSDIGRRKTHGFSPMAQCGKVVEIGLDGVGRKVPFESQIQLVFVGISLPLHCGKEVLY
jgi:hypothetical protein